MSGKWHLSSAGEPDGPNAPHHRGFDQFYGTIYGASDFFAPSDLQWNGKDRTEEWQGKSDYYYTDATTDYALRFLKEGDNQADPVDEKQSRTGHRLSMISGCFFFDFYHTQLRFIVTLRDGRRAA